MVDMLVVAESIFPRLIMVDDGRVHRGVYNGIMTLFSSLSNEMSVNTIHPQ